MARYFPNQSISKIHGKARKEGEITYYAMYHPAAALHQGNLRKIIEADMLKIPQLLTQADKLAEVETEAEPQQLSMF
jgi:DNA polymerase